MDMVVNLNETSLPHNRNSFDACSGEVRGEGTVSSGGEHADGNDSAPFPPSYFRHRVYSIGLGFRLNSKKWWVARTVTPESIPTIPME